MVQMAHHLPDSNPHAQRNQNSFLAVRRPVGFPSVSRREFGQMSPEELLTYNRELARVRESETQDWVARQKAFGLNGMSHEAKRDMLTQNEEVRKHLEKDAYFRANQEYLRLMNEEPSRQTFREKQRLTEDLEKQKRLLIEDLARDQQLKQDKYKRNHPTPFQGDLRTLHYVNDKPREFPVPLRMKPELHMHPFARVEPRYPQPLGTAEEFHSFRRMQENMMKLGKHPADIRQCSHSDFARFSHELGPIIHEKEKKIKEMEEKLIRLENEEKIHYLKKMEHQQQQQFARKSDNTSLHLPRHSQPQPLYRSLTSSSPPQTISRLPYQPNSSPPTSKQQQPQAVHNSAPAIYNNNTSPPSIPPTINKPVEKRELFVTEKRELFATDKNNNNATMSSEIAYNNDEMKKEAVSRSPKKTLHSPEQSNSSHEELVIDEKRQAFQNENIKRKEQEENCSTTPEVRQSPSPQHAADPNRIQIDNTRTSVNDESVTTEVIGDDKEFNEMTFGVKVQISPVKLDENTCPNKEEGDDDDCESKDGGGSNDGNDVNDSSIANRGLKKRKGQHKSAGRRDETSSPSDFQTSQNRLALDLPGHNWLEKRLMQQSALTSNEHSNEKVKEEIVDSESIVPSVATTTDKPRSPPTKIEPFHPYPDTEVSMNGSKSSSSSTSGLTTSSLNTSKPKDLPRSDLLLQMLDSSKSYSKSSSVGEPHVMRESPAEMKVAKVESITARTSPIVITEASKRKCVSPSATPKVVSYDGGDAKEIRTVERVDSPRLISNARSPPTSSASYQEIRPNLVVERRKDSDGSSSSSFPFILAAKSSQANAPPSSIANDNVPYSKFIVEERYNRKRPLEEASREEHEAALKRTEFSERFFSDLERGMLSKGKTEMTILGVDPKEMRLHSSIEQAKLHRRSLEEQSAKERLAKLESTDRDMYLSRFKESQSQPPMSYKTPDTLLKSPTLNRGPLPTQKGDYPLPRYLKRPLSPPNVYRPLEEKLLHRRAPSAEGLTPPVLNGRIDPVHLLSPHHRPESVDSTLMSNLRQSRDLKLLEEARRREKFQRSSIDPRKEGLLSQGITVGKIQGYKPMSPPEEHLLNVNDKIRTVEDLRALQMGMPLANGFQRYTRSNQVLRNERLTEREKLALREADIIHQATMKQEALASRQDIHIAYLEHARRRPSAAVGDMTSPISPTSSVPGMSHGYSEEQMRLASLRRHEDEEKMRAAAAHHERMMEERKIAEPYPISKEMESGHFDASIPRFFSHKIPRTRDGSLDFGRSKPVDYSFLDYSNPGFREREASSGNPLKRPSSAHASSETIAKLPRRTSPQAYLMNKHRLATEHAAAKQHAGNSAPVNPYEEKWRVLEESEKRFCNICNKDAQYLCSGCRKVWYCSQDCQLNAWKTHSKTCSLESSER